MNHPLLSVSPEVADALANGRPVVASESTVIAHGLPYPANFETAIAMEKAIRDGGAVPATIGIMDGRFLIGMDERTIEQFATTEGVRKVSARDIGVVLAGRGLGATTVASTLIAAELAGITVFTTAGIGGVHRGAPQTFDISADLSQFTRSKSIVVCAGAKTVLDLPLTLEYLETVGVPVIGYRCDDFPAFYCTSSGKKNPARIDDLASIACAANGHWSSGQGGSVLVTHPISNKDAIDRAEVEQAIEDALVAADADGISGPAITPYLGKAVSKATGGRTSAANRAVLISTAYLAGQLAVAWAKK